MSGASLTDDHICLPRTHSLQRVLKAEVVKHAKRADEVVQHGSRKNRDKNCSIQ